LIAADAAEVVNAADASASWHRLQAIETDLSAIEGVDELLRDGRRAADRRSITAGTMSGACVFCLARRICMSQF
jgi:hypothetical protein